MQSKRIVVMGLGAIGSNLLLQLSKQFPEFEYTGVDFDEVAERNVRTQAYFLEHVGLKKCLAMKIVLARHVRRPKYKDVWMKVNSGYKIPEADLVIDCFDNTESRKLLNKDNVLHVGFSPHYTAECIWNERYDVPNDVDQRVADICQLGDAASFIGFVVNLTVLNISHYFQTGQKRDFLVTGKTQVKWL